MSRFKHARLARRPGIWRVDGIGPIRDRGRIGLIVEIYFSEISEAGLADPYHRTSVTGETLLLYVHASAIREFKKGTLWRDGQRIQSSPIVPNDLGYFPVSSLATTLKPLGYTVKVAGRWIDSIVPEKYFALGENRQRLASSHYAIAHVPQEGGVNSLIIPCSEILRFYFGVSSRLLSAALQGRLDQYVDWDNSGLEGDTFTLKALTRLSRKEATVLARAGVENSIARAQLMGVHKHLMLTSINNATRPSSNKLPLDIRIAFPFHSDTRLVVSGKRIKLHDSSAIDGKEVWAVLVMEILHCSTPFPFSRLVIESDGLYGAATHNPGNASGIPLTQLPNLDDLDDEELEVNDRPADARLRRLVTLKYTSQFAGFENIVFQHSHSRQGIANPEFIPAWESSETPVDGLTLGNGTHSDEGKGNLGISDFQNRPETIPRDLTLFLEMLEELRRIAKPRGWSIITPRWRDGVTYQEQHLMFFPTNLGGRKSWHLIKEPQGNVRPRQVALAEVATTESERIFYLLEMELRPDETGQCTILLHTNDFAPLKHELFDNLLTLTAERRRWPDRHYTWTKAKHAKLAKSFFGDVQMHRINHLPATKNNADKDRPYSPGAWSDNLLDRILEEFGDI